MIDLETAYCYKFITKAHQVDSCDFDLWRFQSSKSGRHYNVIVEIYSHHMYAVKFYPKQFKNHPCRYTMMTGDGEASRIVATIINIMLGYARGDSQASFIFVAARNKDESRVSKRYRFYSLAMAEKFDNKVFDHKGHPEYNIYMMLRKTEIEAGHISDPDVIGFISEQYVLE